MGGGGSFLLGGFVSQCLHELRGRLLHRSREPWPQLAATLQPASRQLVLAENNNAPELMGVYEHAQLVMHWVSSVL